MDLSASGLTAQRQRLNVIGESLANAQVTRTPQGGPYLRKNVILETRPWKISAA
jgi:flagellar basal-body rod protein FlgC